MGSGFSQLVSCLKPPSAAAEQSPEQMFAGDQLDETLGHSFCYVRSSARFLPSSPNPSARFLSPTHSLRFDDPSSAAAAAAGFKAISGAAVSANSSTPRTVLLPDNVYDDTTALDAAAAARGSLVNGFESTSSFSALPLQPVPRGGDPSGPIERGFFMSGPIERGALSGPLDASAAGSGDGAVPFSAPLGGMYGKKRKKKSFPGFRKAFYRNFSEKKRPWVVPVRYLVGRKEVAAAAPPAGDAGESLASCESNVQWALGKAGEDRVHVVVSEEHGWLFVGIYDGFNGPDAPEFLMGNLYRSVFNELEGLFWDVEEAQAPNVPSGNLVAVEESNPSSAVEASGAGGEGEPGARISESGNELNPQAQALDRVGKRVTFQPEQPETRRKRLWEYLAEDDSEHGLDLSGSDRFAFSVDDALSVSNAGSSVRRRRLLLSKLKHGLSKHKEGHGRRLFPWRFGLEDKEKIEIENRVEERSSRRGRKRKVGPVDHQLVLGALSRALEATELAYLDMTDKFLDSNPELALMGSCLLVVLMRDEDVYVMNLGDSRAIVAQYEQQELATEVDARGHADVGSSKEGIVEEPTTASENVENVVHEGPVQETKLTALQLSTDHSTSIEEEVIRIKNEHPDDNQCIVNDRVKGRLKVTRAFGAGFLKQPKLNDSLLEMFRNEFVGTAPYLSCSPSLCHHKLCPRDQFLVLSSDGLYQYLSNEEVVLHVENFIDKFPDGDPAQHLIEELLFRAAKKAGMDFHELLDIPQGDRRKYHDDVTVMVISLEGRIWKSSGKYL